MVKCSEVELSNLLATYELYSVKKPQRRLRVFDICWSSVARVVESSFQKPYLTITWRAEAEMFHRLGKNWVD